MRSEYIAHVRKSDGTLQSVATHLTETAAIAKMLAAKLGLDLAGEILGLMHDFGKYSEAFQQYIRSVTGVDPDADNDFTLPNGKKIDHSTAGAQWVYRHLKGYGKKGEGALCGQILGLCIVSHHGAGLIDCLDPEGKLDENGNTVWEVRFNKDDALTHLSECEQSADESVLQQAQGLAGKDLLVQMLAQLKRILSADETSHLVKEFYLGYPLCI